jgi:hypothetical protein
MMSMPIGRLDQIMLRGNDIWPQEIGALAIPCSIGRLVPDRGGDEATKDRLHLVPRSRQRPHAPASHNQQVTVAAAAVRDTAGIPARAKMGDPPAQLRTLVTHCPVRVSSSSQSGRTIHVGLCCQEGR